MLILRDVPAAHIQCEKYVMVFLYHWSVGLDERLGAEAATWVRRFSVFLGGPPYGVSCIVRPVDDGLAEMLAPVLAETEVASIAVKAVEILTDHLTPPTPNKRSYLPKLLIFCRANGELAAKVRFSNPNAIWGGSVGMCFAVVNHHEPSVAWHELFHLFGAKDCYDENAPDEMVPPLCGNANCLMQYAPLLERVGDPPFLCDPNIRRIRQKYYNNGREES